MHCSRALRLLLVVLLMGLLLPRALAADESFTVQKIQVHGLERISDGTFYTYLPISVGDHVDAGRVRAAIKALYQTGFFQTIQLRRDGNTLIVDVQERPSIQYFTLEGNKAIDSDTLNKTLSQIGLAKGRIFSRSVLKDVKQQLTNEYFSHGKYAVKIKTDVKPAGNNKVDVTIHISEGVDTTIKSIDIVGNKTFDDETLLDQFKLQPEHFLSFFQSDDKYEREKLVGDLESLRSYYMDRGYADFHVEAVQVAISPDHKHIYITIDVHEGEVYKVNKVELAGKFVVPEQQLRRLVLVQPGTTFSMARATATSTLMSNLLGNNGYAFAKVDPVPKLDHDKHEVDLTFFVNPGNRAYVRRINFEGMPDTNDVVFRREMRQFEGTWLSNVDLKRSKIRLQRLQFVKDVQESTDPVPGSPDLVDLNYKLTPRQAGRFIFSLGYSPYEGFLIGGQIEHDNFLGAGDVVNISLNTSQINKMYDISFTDPYATVNGVSRTVRAYYTKSTQLIIDTSPLDTTSYGASLLYGIPFTEYDSFLLGASAGHTDLLTNMFSSSQQYIDFASDPANGTTYETPIGPGIRYRQLDFLTGWTHDTRNRVIFATRGDRQQINLDVATPASDIKYYKLTLESTNYVPIGGGFLYLLHGVLGVNKTYGTSHTVPLSEHFFVGGPDSVRGFRAGYLGPLDNIGFPAGGNFEAYAQNEIIIPSLFGFGGAEAQGSTRFSFFVDVGNAFAEPGDFQFGDLYKSVGIAGQFITPLGIMRVSVARPLGTVPSNLTETFQFEVGRFF